MSIDQVAKGTRVRVLTVPGVDYWRSEGEPRPESGEYTGRVGTVTYVDEDDSGLPLRVLLDPAEDGAPEFFLSLDDVEVA